MSQNESNNEREESSDNEQDESSDNEREESSQSTCNFKGRHKSFVWDYFEKDNNGITSTCKIILDDGKECGVSYNDGSTTSNLINHLARRHWIFKNTPCRPSNAIKGQFIRTENEYELIRQDLISFIIDDSQPFNIVECKSFRKLLHSLDENFSIPCDKTVKTTVSQSFSWSKLQLINMIENDMYLPSRFQSDESASVRKDGERLARIMLSDDEWIFLDELNDILCGFEEVTTLLSGNSYVTISLMYPAISVLVKTLKSSLQQFYIETVSTDMSELTILDYMEEIIDDTKDFIEIKEVDLTSEIIHKKIDISVSMITIGMLEKVKKIFYDSMYKYWQSVTDVGMLACLLDPRFKKLRFASANIIQKTNDHLKKLYESECEVYMASNHSTPLSNIQNEDLDTSMLPRKRKSILSELYADNNNTINEIDEYL
ncbi:22806_t:CDS:2, partial [Gigaspora margarita]